MEVCNNGLELALEGFVETGEATIGGKDAVVERVTVHDGLGFDLVGDALQPLALGSGPSAGRKDGLEGVLDPLNVGQQRRAESTIADVADNGRGNVLILPLPPGGTEIDFLIAGFVEGQFDLLQLGAVRQ